MKVLFCGRKFWWSFRFREVESDQEADFYDIDPLDSYLNILDTLLIDNRFAIIFLIFETDLFISDDFAELSSFLL